jgi:hypothetical protein
MLTATKLFTATSDVVDIESEVYELQKCRTVRPGGARVVRIDGSIGEQKLHASVGEDGEAGVPTFRSFKDGFQSWAQKALSDRSLNQHRTERLWVQFPLGV